MEQCEGFKGAVHLLGIIRLFVMIVRIIFVQRRPVIFSKFQTKKTFRRAKNKLQEDTNEEFSFGHKSCKNKRNFGFSLFFRFSGEASSFEKSPSACLKNVSVLFPSKISSRRVVSPDFCHATPDVA